MRVSLITPPTTEPVSLAEMKLHLRLDSGTFAENITETQSIAPGSHAIANNYTTHVGASVDVLGYQAVVMFQSGPNGAGGTVDVKIQESNDDATWTDWTGGAFTQVTTANDNATYEKEYTGAMRYIRTVAKVLVANCSFGTTIIRFAATAADDDLLTVIIKTAREYVEDITRRALLTQTWEYYLDAFPMVNFIKLPFGNLQNAEATKPILTYKDSEGTETTMTVTTDYLVQTNGEALGRIVLPNNVSWPSFTAYPSNPITIKYVCGWTDKTLIPAKIRTAIKLIAAKLYEQRGNDIIGLSVAENKFYHRLLDSAVIWDEF